MRKIAVLHFSVIAVFTVVVTGFGRKYTHPQQGNILKIEMQLSAFGVESDDFPSIEAVIDFRKDSSICTKSFYHPDKKGNTYSLTPKELDTIKQLLTSEKLDKLKSSYSTDVSDQPTSTTIIYTLHKKYIIKDYGLTGDEPLKELYKIVYKLN